MYSLGQRNFVFHKKRKRFLCSTLHAQKSGTVFKVYTKNAVQARKTSVFLSENRSFSFIWMLLLQPDVTFSIYQILSRIFGNLSACYKEAPGQRKRKNKVRKNSVVCPFCAPFYFPTHKEKSRKHCIHSISGRNKKCGRWDLNPHERIAHKILSLARLPVPTLPHIAFPWDSFSFPSRQVIV